MKVIVAQFMQESNSFTSVRSSIQNFHDCFYEQGCKIRDSNSAYTGPTIAVIEELESEGIEAIPAVAACAWSSGPVSFDMVNSVLDTVYSVIEKNKDADGIFLTLHGAMAIDGDPDAEGYFLEKIRNAIGEKAVITAGLDFHANITRRMMRNADILCGYKTYPHMDMNETSLRAARLGIDLLKKRKKAVSIHIKLPMLLQAETSMTIDEPMKSVVGMASQLEKDGVYDISVFQMQPWLDTYDAGASVIAIADDAEKALRAADKVARHYWKAKDTMQYKLFNLDTLLDISGKENGKPCIISDSADSPTAGSPGDSVFVISRVLERGMKLKGCATVVDAVCVEKAFQVGVGTSCEFTVGGTLDTLRAKPLKITAEVIGLNERPIEACGIFGQELLYVGRSAVLKVEELYLVVMSCSVTCCYPELYLGHGLDITGMDFIVVKSAAQYKEYYRKFTNLMFTADTPGASSADLHSFIYQRMERPMYPFDDIAEYKVKICEIGHYMKVQR